MCTIFSDKSTQFYPSFFCDFSSMPFERYYFCLKFEVMYAILGWPEIVLTIYYTEEKWKCYAEEQFHSILSVVNCKRPILKSSTTIPFNNMN